MSGQAGQKERNKRWAVSKGCVLYVRFFCCRAGAAECLNVQWMKRECKWPCTSSGRVGCMGGLRLERQEIKAGSRCVSLAPYQKENALAEERGPTTADENKGRQVQRAKAESESIGGKAQRS